MTVTDYNWGPGVSLWARRLPWLLVDKMIPEGWRFVLSGEALKPYDIVAYGTQTDQYALTGLKKAIADFTLDALRRRSLVWPSTLEAAAEGRVLRPCQTEAYEVPDLARWQALKAALTDGKLHPSIMDVSNWEFAGNGWKSQLLVQEHTGSQIWTRFRRGELVWTTIAALPEAEVKSKRWRYPKPDWYPAWYTGAKEQEDTSPASVSGVPDERAVELAKQRAVFFPKRVDPTIARLVEGDPWFAETLRPYELRLVGGTRANVHPAYVEHKKVGWFYGSVRRVGNYLMRDFDSGAAEEPATVHAVIPVQDVALFKREQDAYGAWTRVYLSGHRQVDEPADH